MKSADRIASHCEGPESGGSQVVNVKRSDGRMNSAGRLFKGLTRDAEGASWGSGTPGYGTEPPSCHHPSAAVINLEWCPITLACCRHLPFYRLRPRRRRPLKDPLTKWHVPEVVLPHHDLSGSSRRVFKPAPADLFPSCYRTFLWL